MKLEQTGLANVLKGHRLVVPPNQRNYAWEGDQVAQYLEDLTRAQRAGEDHFLGTLVTIARDGGILEVVDGQQRLATTTLLLVAIRDRLRSLDDDMLVQSVDTDYLFIIDRKQRERVTRLQLNVEDDEFFAALVKRDDGAALPECKYESHDLMLNAYNLHVAHVESVLKGVPKDVHGDFLNEWVTFLDDQAGVVLLQVYDDTNAYRMFETLNDRGLKTSQADLVKNHLFGASGDKLGQVQARWSYMRGALESLDEDDVTIDFLRYAVIAMSGPKREADLYRTIKTLSTSAPKALALATQLDDLAGVYAATLNSDHARWNTYNASARKALQVLNLLDIRPMRPLVLAVAARMSQGPATKSFRFLASLGVRLLIASSTRSAGVEQPLSDTAAKVYAGTVTTITDLKAELAGITPSDSAFESAFAEARVANSRLARYYLRSFELAKSGDSEPYFIPNDSEVINLEHVLPRKPGDNWKSWTDDDRKNNISRLGNQALMRATDNGHIKSDAFDDKKPSLAKSPYYWTSCIAKESEWTPVQVEARQKALASLAPAAWPV
jgi:hypothetical protein